MMGSVFTKNPAGFSRFFLVGVVCLLACIFGPTDSFVCMFGLHAATNNLAACLHTYYVHSCVPYVNGGHTYIFLICSSGSVGACQPEEFDTFKYQHTGTCT